MADHDFPVDASSILMFASALGESNPIYYDEEYAKGTPLGGVIAPPTFAIASAHWNPTYSLRGVREIPAAPEGGKRSEGVGSEEGGDLTRVLHGEQRFEYHQPLRPGMKLRVSNRAGKTWDKEGKRGGKLRFSETISEFRDEDGNLIVTATSVGIVTEKAVEN